MSDPFSTLGLTPALDIARSDLEARYLELSRACHPDHHASGALDDDQQMELLDRAAAVNNAYRVLRDPWRRAEALLELEAPGVVDRNKQLDPEFLMEAMELAESVSALREAPGDDARLDALAAELTAAIEAARERLATAVAAANFDAAAVLLHESRYHRKALADLRAGDTR